MPAGQDSWSWPPVSLTAAPLSDHEYRLYSMIHARSRPEALDVLSAAAALPELTGVPHRALFSLQCFKQTGALISLEKGTAA